MQGQIVCCTAPAVGVTGKWVPPASGPHVSDVYWYVHYSRGSVNHQPWTPLCCELLFFFFGRVRWERGFGATWFWWGGCTETHARARTREGETGCTRAHNDMPIDCRACTTTTRAAANSNGNYGLRRRPGSSHVRVVGAPRARKRPSQRLGICHSAAEMILGCIVFVYAYNYTRVAY